VIIPEAAINGWHPMRHASVPPSANNLKRIGDELSALAATSTF